MCEYFFLTIKYVYVCLSYNWLGITDNIHYEMWTDLLAFSSALSFNVEFC